MKDKKAIEFLKKNGFPWKNIKPYVPEPKKNYKTEREKHRAFFKKHKKLFKQIVDERRFRITELRWDEGKTYREIGELFSITPARASQISARVIELVEQKLQKDN
jgi:DNA-directed RNA polymerase specialized sigma subunit